MAGLAVLVSRCVAVALVLAMSLSVVSATDGGRVLSDGVEADNLPPVFNTPLEPEYYVEEGESFTFSVVVSDPDNDPLKVNWSFGNGEEAQIVLTYNTSEPTMVCGTTTYEMIPWMVVSVTVSDGVLGHTIGCNASVVVVGSGIPAPYTMVGYWWHNMFNEPFGEWWDMRNAYYENVEVVSDSYPYVYRTIGPWGTESYRSNMRLNVMSDNLTTVSMNENPQFLPYLGTERGGMAVVDWYMQYLTEAEASRYPDAVPAWLDGWVTCLNGTVFLDNTAANAVLGIADDDFEDFELWWAANRYAIQNAFIEWMYDEGNDRLDIFPMYEYAFTPLYFSLDAYCYDDNVVLSYDLVSWGMEALLTKWLRDAFMPTEWWFEDFSMHAEIFPDRADIDVDTAVVGALFAWKDMSTMIPSWAWRGMLQDYIPSSLAHPVSAFDTYEDLQYMSMYAGSVTYGGMIPFDYTPGAFNLRAGEEMWFEYPAGAQTFIVDGEFLEYATEQYEMASPYSEPDMSDLPTNVEVDTSMRTITFQGPMNASSWSESQTAHEYLESEWDRLGVLPYGMPWIEFRADMTPSELIVPTAVIGPVPSVALVGEMVTFDASASYDPDGVIESYAWDFGDGSVASGATVTHAYDASGWYNVTLTVVDDDGLFGMAQTGLTVASIPTASMTFLPLVPGVEEVVTFWAYDSYDEYGIVDCYWTFGDGANASGWQVQHAYSEKGDYTVTLTVVNTYGIAATVEAVLEVGGIGSGVRGVVVSETAKPLKNAEAQVFKGDMLVGSARTNGNGEFLIRGLLPGDYSLVVMKKGYSIETMSISVGEGVLDVGTIVLERDRSALVTAVLAPDTILPLMLISAVSGMAAVAAWGIHRARAKRSPA